MSNKTSNVLPQGNDLRQQISGFMGQRLMFFCRNFVYVGIVAHVGEDFVALNEPYVVFETGALTDKKFKDAQPLPHEWHVPFASCEGFGRPREPEDK